MKQFLLPIISLAQEERQEMFCLFNTHFEADLSSKQWTVLLKQEPILNGFSLSRFSNAVLKNEPARIVYSGYTITDP